jgi:hypothetical protein
MGFVMKMRYLLVAIFAVVVPKVALANVFTFVNSVTRAQGVEIDMRGEFPEDGRVSVVVPRGSTKEYNCTVRAMFTAMGYSNYKEGVSAKKMEIAYFYENGKRRVTTFFDISMLDIPLIGTDSRVVITIEDNGMCTIIKDYDSPVSLKCDFATTDDLMGTRTIGKSIYSDWKKVGVGALWDWSEDV